MRLDSEFLSARAPIACCFELFRKLFDTKDKGSVSTLWLFLSGRGLRVARSRTDCGEARDGETPKYRSHWNVFSIDH